MNPIPIHGGSIAQGQVARGVPTLYREVGGHE